MPHSPRIVLRLVALSAAIVTPSGAQSGPGGIWTEFGPWQSQGAYFEITRNHEGPIPAGRLATDSRHRLIAVNTWRDTELDTNDDCAVTRRLADAKFLDMDWTGELEATRRIAFDLGGSNADRCTAIAVDPSDRPVIVGRASTPTGDRGFAVRLRADNGDYDDSFSGDGKFNLGNLAAFSGLPTALWDVATLPDGRAVACGGVVRNGESNMLVMRWTAGGTLDVSFAGVGWREIDWDSADPDNESCSALELLPDGRLALAGAADGALSGERGYAIVRLEADGDFDTSFGGSGRVWLADVSDYSEPDVVDLAYNPANGRLFVAADLESGGLSAGNILAVTASGTLATSFGNNGHLYVRFSEIAMPSDRESGATRIVRILVGAAGRIYVAGTHENSANDAAVYGDSDLALARFRSDGTVDSGAATGFSGDGVRFLGFSHFGHKEVESAATRRWVSDTLKDAIFYRGNVLLLSQTNRHPEGSFGGEYRQLGPVAPLVAGVIAERIHDEDFELDGLPVPTGFSPVLDVPFGYGRYCSVRNPTGGGYGLLPAGPAADPCQQFLDENPSAIVERAGLYSTTGLNHVLAVCDGGYIGMSKGNGTAPFNEAFAATAGKSNCVFTASPAALPVFDRPYTGEHVRETAQSFNHDTYNVGIDVTEFGQTPAVDHPLAHWIDLNGAQKCTNTHGHTTWVLGGVDEAAVDIPVLSDRDGIAVAAGRVVAAVPRYRLGATPIGTDPYQREVYVRHTVGAGRYAEVFTLYYAHFYDTRVRRGDIVAAGDVLGQVGNNGGSTGEHLHLATFRHRNLSFRSSFEIPFERADFHLGKEVGAIDAWGWRAPQGFDPAAWRFRYLDGERIDAGAWSINLWRPGEEPTMQ